MPGSRKGLPRGGICDDSGGVRQGGFTADKPSSWALKRRDNCGVCGPAREQIRSGYCASHLTSLRKAIKRGQSESQWLPQQSSFPPHPPCIVNQCVHDGGQFAFVGPEARGSARGTSRRGAAMRGRWSHQERTYVGGLAVSQKGIGTRLTALIESPRLGSPKFLTCEQRSV